MVENTSEELKEKAEELKEKAEEIKAKAESKAKTEINKEKIDETYNKGKDVAEKVGENLSKTLEDTIIAIKAIQKNFDNKYQGYKESANTNKINLDLAETEDNYYLQAYLAGVPKEEIIIEASEDTITVKAELKNIYKNINKEADLIISGVKEGVAERTIKLSNKIIKEGINAKQNNGILFITIPKKEIQKTTVNID